MATGMSGGSDGDVGEDGRGGRATAEGRAGEGEFGDATPRLVDHQLGVT